MIPWWLLALSACSEPKVCDEGTLRDGGTACVPYTPGDPEPAVDVGLVTGVTWQWQLTGAIDTTVDVDVYDVDLFEVPDDGLTTLHADGRIVVCYFSAGSYEPWRPDAGDYPDEVVGVPLDGWPDERWVDTTSPVVRGILEARLDLAVARGCDAVEPDNLTAWDTRSGFGINRTEQLDFNRFVGDAARSRGLAVALKNDVEQTRELVDWFDFTVNEECADYDECQRVRPFVDAGKAVLHAEYVDRFAQAPDKADEVCGIAGFSTIVKEWDLGPELLACP